MRKENTIVDQKDIDGMASSLIRDILRDREDPDVLKRFEDWKAKKKSADTAMFTALSGLSKKPLQS